MGGLYIAYLWRELCVGHYRAEELVLQEHQKPNRSPNSWI